MYTIRRSRGRGRRSFDQRGKQPNANINPTYAVMRARGESLGGRAAWAIWVKTARPIGRPQGILTVAVVDTSVALGASTRL